MKIKKILNKNKSIYFVLEIYHQDIYFIYGDLDKAVKKISPEVIPEFKEKFSSVIKELQELEYRGVYTSRHPFRIIHMHKVEKLSDFMSVLAHEVLHLTFELLSYRGMKLGSKSEEAYTHLHDHILEIIIQKMFENK